jgi:hypothetical protein
MQNLNLIPTGKEENSLELYCEWYLFCSKHSKPWICNKTQEKIFLTFSLFSLIVLHSVSQKWSSTNNNVFSAFSKC